MNTDKLAKYGIKFDKYLFIDPKAFVKYVSKSVAIILGPFLVVMFWVFFAEPFHYRDPMFVLVPMAAFFATMPIFFLLFNRISSNMSAFLFRDDEFYRITIGNQDINLANLITRCAGSIIGALVALRGNQQREQLQAALMDDRVFKQISTLNICLRIINVKSIRPTLGGYKISCVVEKGKSKKIKNKTIFIKRGFNDFDKLVKLFEYVKDTKN